MHREFATFQSGAYTLTATLDLPDGVRVDSPEPKAPAALFCHGFTGHRIESRRMYARLGVMLAQCGIATLRFDHRGCGESDGEFIEFTPAGLLEDLDAALAFFLAIKCFDRQRMAAVGYSLGGTSASYLLHRHPEFRTAVYWAPVARPDIVRDRLSQYPGFQGYTERGFFDYAGFRVSSEYLDHIGEMMNPLEWSREFKGPILFCHGEDDPIVRPEQSDQYVSTRKNTGDEKLLIPNADHGFSTAENIDLLLKTSSDWLCDKLGVNNNR